MYEVTGIVKEIKDEQVISDKLTKRELWLEIPDGRYPQLCAFEFINDNCMKLDLYRIGQEVKLKFGLRGRQWKEKVFNSLVAFHIEAAGAYQEKGTAKAKPVHTDLPEETDDLPF